MCCFVSLYYRFTKKTMSHFVRTAVEFVNEEVYFTELFEATNIWRQHLLYKGFRGGSAGKEYACNAWDLSSIPRLGRFPGEGKGYPLQYFGLENSVDCIVHGVTKSRTWLSDFHLFLFSYKIIKIHLWSSSEVKTLEPHMMAGLSNFWKASHTAEQLRWCVQLEVCGLVCDWTGLRTQRWNSLNYFNYYPLGIIF